MPRYMRTRPMLHEAEAEVKTYEAEATKFGLEVTSVVPISACPLQPLGYGSDSMDEIEMYIARISGRDTLQTQQTDRQTDGFSMPLAKRTLQSR